jgi:acyl-CoA thioesterase-1
MRIICVIAAVLLFSACRKAPENRAGTAPAQKPDAASETRVPDHRPVIVAFGDSLTAGFGADPGKSYPDFLQRNLDRHGYHYRVVNAGISGETTTDALARLATVTALKPVIVIVEFGGNDGLRGLPVATTRSNLEQIIDALKPSGTEIVLAGMTLPPNYGPDYIRKFQSIYTDLAAREKVTLIPFLLAGVAGTTRYMQQDGLHPTAEGNRLVAATVMKYLEPLLNKRAP